MVQSKDYIQNWQANDISTFTGKGLILHKKNSARFGHCGCFFFTVALTLPKSRGNQSIDSTALIFYHRKKFFCSLQKFQIEQFNLLITHFRFLKFFAISIEIEVILKICCFFKNLAADFFTFTAFQSADKFSNE